MLNRFKVALLATLMALSFNASAVSVNEAGGTGQVLIFPYYNVNNSYITSYNITNTTNTYKALKFRFRESENSNDVLDFNVYLSPFDVFTLSLTKGLKGGVLMRTTDKSCTHPTIPADGVEFRHAAYFSTDLSDVEEGYLEVIEMGTIDQSAVLIDRAGTQFVASGGILHVDGRPKDCTVIERAWQTGVFTQGGAASNTESYDIVNPQPTGYPVQNVPSEAGFYGQGVIKGVLAPTGGIVGSSILIDIAHISGFVTEPLSVRGYSTVAQHYLSSDENFYLLPSLASGSSTVSEREDSLPALYSTVIRDWGLDDKDTLPRTGVPSGINPMPISDAMLISKLGNQYFLGLNTFTDWVVSAPMRKHGIYNDYQYMPADPSLGSLPAKAIAIGAIGIVPSEAEKLQLARDNGYWKFLSEIDVNASFVYYDREEGSRQVDPGDFSPPIVTPDTRVPFQREVNILAFTTEERAFEIEGVEFESVLGSEHAQGVILDAGFRDGWGSMSFNSPSYNLAGARYADWVEITPSSAFGVPVFGFMAARSDLSPDASVGETFPHFFLKDR